MVYNVTPVRKIQWWKTKTKFVWCLQAIIVKIRAGIHSLLSFFLDIHSLTHAWNWECRFSNLTSFLFFESWGSPIGWQHQFGRLPACSDNFWLCWSLPIHSVCKSQGGHRSSTQINWWYVNSFHWKQNGGSSLS